jgi:peroxiredoxin
VAFASIMEELGSPAPDFQLPNTNPNAGPKVVSLGDFSAMPALLVAFVCNCFSKFACSYANQGLGIVAISANDISTHPGDGPQKMADEALAHNFSYPYLYDETQDTAKAYRAACTPDFFLYDSQRKLVYRGQFDASRPNNDIPVDGSALQSAVDAVLSGQPVTTEQVPSLGCNIKWKSGQEPDYFPT